MDPTDRISVIMPVFNGERFFRQALQSVLLQTRKVHELIIVDDGSTDHSLKAIHAALGEFSPAMPVAVLEQENQGQSASRNTGVDRSTGTLIAFLDQDDLWHPRHIEVLSSPFSSDPELGWAYSDFNEIDVKGRLVTRGFIASNNFHHPKTAIQQLLSEDNMVVPSASVLRKEAFLNVGGFDPRLRGYEDDDLFIRIFQTGWRMKYFREPVTSFRVHPGSSSDNSSFRASRMIFFEKLAESFPDDRRLNRLYVSDLLIPRLMNSTVTEYAIALQARQYRDARLIAGSIRTLLSKRPRMRLRVKFGLALLSHPRLCRMVLRVRQLLPEALRPAISPALVLRD